MIDMTKIFKLLLKPIVMFIDSRIESRRNF